MAALAGLTASACMLRVVPSRPSLIRTQLRPPSLLLNGPESYEPAYTMCGAPGATATRLDAPISPRLVLAQVWPLSRLVCSPLTVAVA